MPLSREIIEHSELSKLLDSVSPTVKYEFLDNHAGMATRMLHTVLEDNFTLEVTENICIRPILGCIGKDDTDMRLVINETIDVGDVCNTTETVLNLDNVQRLINALRHVEAYLIHGILPCDTMNDITYPSGD